MKQQWLQWQAAFMTLPQPRRRFWLLLSVIVVLYLGVWMYLLPLRDSSVVADQQQRQLTVQINAARNELAGIQQRLQSNPKAPLERQLEQQQQRLTRVTEQLAKETRYISAADNRDLLRALLTTAAGVKVRSAQALPVEQVYRDPQDTNTGIYKHRLQLVITGSYFDIHNYFETLEGLPWAFYWQRMDYRVTSYPNAEVTVEIYTLSLERDYVAS
ncbi:hypothetical protein [Pseudidiomarina mangrovi]|uniref:hypothetical protein n=1 Tax=Pseudidiomarina mangrovi TaxID=2487133 RepID=UPI000FCC1BEA|nr:hypothetical protein [Pseudidiomarina mangrovi]